MTPTIDDRIIQGADLRRYVFDRKLHSDESRWQQQLGMSQIVIHNAHTIDEVEKLLQGIGLLRHAEKYTPRLSTEPHYFIKSHGVLHTVNSRGLIRLRRDQDLAAALAEIIGRPIEVVYNHYQNNPAAAAHRFKHFAYKLVEEVAPHLERNGLTREKKISVLCGPFASLPLEGKPDIDVIAVRDSDFLNYRLLHIGGQLALNLDYVFGDQARNVLDNLYTLLSARFDDIAVNVFHYGKVGGLYPGLSMGQVTIPSGSIDEQQVIRGERRVSPVYNGIAAGTPTGGRFAALVAEQPFQGATLNTVSVLTQRRSELEQAFEAGGMMLDMEWSAMAGLEHGARSCYPRLGPITSFFAGIVSDLPLQGKTLGSESYDRTKEARVATAFAELIKESA